ncbi:MAG: hypothetical protein KME29_29550 [Calothrix sp. FI2-JRJ7]|jgi:hypothetical protein|nr:hypothetical protein [Calothrix sp. FI2-JRJ7]
MKRPARVNINVYSQVAPVVRIALPLFVYFYVLSNIGLFGLYCLPEGNCGHFNAMLSIR